MRAECVVELRYLIFHLPQSHRVQLFNKKFVLCAPVGWANVIYPISHEACTLYLWARADSRGFRRGHERRSSLDVRQLSHRAN
jgi:hypothetical protein